MKNLRKKQLRIILLGFSCLFCSQVEAKTSMTDNNTYPQFCQKAANNQDIFNNFKRATTYSRIVENVSKRLGREFLNIILKQSPEILQHLDAFKQNDLYGNPKTYNYPETGVISPSTLRYIKIASDLEKRFGNLDGCTVVEIGGGYGGQCKILSDLFHLKEYILIDLPDPLALAKKYLETLDVPNITFLTHTDHIPVKEFDLVISNYALSECTIAMQREYIEKVLSHAKNGYVTCNQITTNKTIYPTKPQVLKMFSEYQIPWEEQPEKPLTAKGNYLLIW